MIETIGNPQLEAEYLASMFLKGTIVAPSIIQLRMDFAQIPVASIGSDFDELLVGLQKEIVSPLGLLKDSVMVSYLQGNQKDVLDLVKQLHQRSSEFLPLMQQGLQLKEMQHVQEVEQTMMDNTDIVDMGDKIKAITVKSEGLDSVRQNMIELLKLNTRLEEIITLYGTENNKFPKGKDLTGNLDKYQMYIIELQNHMDELVTDPLVSMKLAVAIDSLGQVRPQDNLDPYKQELFVNLIEILSNPKDYYKDCKTEKVVGQIPGMLFTQTYPEFSQKFLSMYLEDYESMSFPEQINFRNCFAIPADNSELLQLTNNYIKMSYT